MKRFLQRLFCALAAVPFLLKVPYVLGAWRSSPLDAFDIVFVPVTAGALIWGCVKLHRLESQYFDWKPLVLILPLAGVAAFLQMRSLNAPTLLCTWVLCWLIWWCVRGWDYGWRILPAFVIGLLLTTSGTYWICFFTGLDVSGARLLKCLVAGGCLASLYAINEFNWMIRGRTLVLSVMALVALAVYWESHTHLQTYRPYAPTFTPTSAHGYVGREIPPGAGVQRLFRTGDIHLFRYADKTGPVSVLAVACGADIHEVHPAAHCLRSSGWTILRERPYETVFEGNPFQVTEVEALVNGSRVLVWVWYSNEEMSTGSFICFRQKATKPETWHTYQISVPLGHDVEVARRSIARFLHR